MKVDLQFRARRIAFLTYRRDDAQNTHEDGFSHVVKRWQDYLDSVESAFDDEPERLVAYTD